MDPLILKAYIQNCENKPGLLECSENLKRGLPRDSNYDFKEESLQKDSFNGGIAILASEDGNVFLSKQV